jgi:sialate O-acetylesterase
MKPPLRPTFAALLLPALSGTNDACGAIRLVSVFSSNMVLQRDVPAKISGTADVGETVAVKLGHQVVGAAVGAGPEKSWAITLPVLKAGPIPDITIEGTNTIRLTNLLAGDVWVCSGQSNMEMSLQSGPWCKYGGVINAEQEVAAARHPQIRLWVMLSKQPWAECSPETARSFSAAGYFFGRNLLQKLDVPIGLIQAAVGGTAAEYWTPRAVRETWPGFAAALAEARRILPELLPLDTADRQALTDWQKSEEVVRKNGAPPPPRPAPRLSGEQQEKLRAAREVDRTGIIYASRIQPLSVMNIKGAIWYQGESNAGRAAEYPELMSQLIHGWRAAFGQGNFPFLIMQLVNFDAKTGDWPALRAAQQVVAETVPNTGLAIGIDIGDPRNIHPANKQEVGRRLALVALKQVYGQDVVAAGPKLTGAHFEPGKAVLTFDPGGRAQQLILKTGVDSGFDVAGRDGKFLPAAAATHGNVITVATPSISEPRVVRYAWRQNPSAALFNTAGLPAAPFHTEAKGARPP